jgi:hypothetical protein
MSIYLSMFNGMSLLIKIFIKYNTHLHTNSTQSNTMKQNTQNITYITIRIHKHNNNNTQFTQTAAHKNTTTYTMIKKCNQKKVITFILLMCTFGRAPNNAI